MRQRREQQFFLCLYQDAEDLGVSDKKTHTVLEYSDFCSCLFQAGMQPTTNKFLK